MDASREQYSMIKGWIDFSLDDASSGVPRIGGGDPDSPGRRVVSPAVDVSVEGPAADLAVDGGRIVACTGAPRFADADVQRVAVHQGRAMGWLNLFATRGAEGLSRVSGRYAVAFADVNARSAILATDRFAIEPLCFSHHSARLSFASRADSVPAALSREIDLQALYDYLYFHVIPTPRTVFHGVARLPPAHRLVVAGSEISLERHWTPAFGGPGIGNVAELGDRFRALVRESVAREASEGDVGCFLSGGTDSSTVAGMLAQVAGGSASSYSIGFEAEGYDEMAYARIAAKHFGTCHHEYYVTPDDLVRAIPEVARHYDQPFGNSSALPTYFCARIARSDGRTKLLAGDGGDELFGGNTRYATQRIFEAYHCLPAAVRSSAIEPVLLGNAWLERVPLVRKGVSYVRQARLPMPDRLNTYNLLDWIGADELLEPAFLRLVDRGDPQRQQRANYRRVDGALVNAMLLYDWKYTLADNDLPKVCRASELAGIAVGFPFLADEIVDLSLRLPVSQKVHGLKLRYFFKRALRGFLPDAIIAKKKHGFGLPFGPWLIRHAALQRLARDTLARLSERGIVRSSFLDDLMARRIGEHPGFFGEMVWILCMLEHWLAAHAPRFAVPRG